MSTNDRRTTSAPPHASWPSRVRMPMGAPAESETAAQSEQARSAADRYADTRTMLVTIAVLGGAVALAATAQAVIVLGIPDELVGNTVPLSWDLGRRIFINLLTVISTLLIVSQLRIETRRPVPAAALVLAAGVGVAGLRAVMQITVGIYSQHDVLPALADAAVSGVMISLIIAFAVYVTRSQQRIRRAERTSHLSAAQSSQALVTLLRTQARARHKLAAANHETLKERFGHVMDEIGEIIDDADGLMKLRMQSVQRELAEAAVAGQQGLAMFTYPESLDHGLVPAVRAFITAVPNPIAIRLRVSDPGEVHAATGAGPIQIERRAVLFQTIVEATLNALEFCRAQRIDVEIGVTAGMVRVSIADDAVGRGEHREAPGFDNMRRQVSGIGGRLESELLPTGGCRVVAFAPRIPSFA